MHYWTIKAVEEIGSNYSSQTLYVCIPNRLVCTMTQSLSEIYGTITNYNHDTLIYDKRAMLHSQHTMTKQNIKQSADNGHTMSILNKLQKKTSYLSHQNCYMHYHSLPLSISYPKDHCCDYL